MQWYMHLKNDHNRISISIPPSGADEAMAEAIEMWLNKKFINKGGK